SRLLLGWVDEPSLTAGSATICSETAAAAPAALIKVAKPLLCFNKQDLLLHNSSVHKADPRPFQCDTCGRQFATAAYLCQHRRIHTGQRPYGCKYCDKRFTQLSHVQQHERIHTGDKPYRCWHCAKSFTQMSNLQSHQRQHTKDKPHRCDACHMCFDSREELDTHAAARHSTNKYSRVLLCRVCGKAYNSETYLSKHLAKHRDKARQAEHQQLQQLQQQQQQQAAEFSAHIARLCRRLRRLRHSCRHRLNSSSSSSSSFTSTFTTIITTTRRRCLSRRRVLRLRLDTRPLPPPPLPQPLRPPEATQRPSTVASRSTPRRLRRLLRRRPGPLDRSSSPSREDSRTASMIRAVSLVILVQHPGLKGISQGLN
uniref:Protein krueppel n=1 Tax=Macrostomum lignano TaxID=282301 RepID=A0A1I8FSK3_9PLAT